MGLLFDSMRFKRMEVDSLDCTGGQESNDQTHC
jgi:hypothetical protein